jgi:hypothetical protein
MSTSRRTGSPGPVTKADIEQKLRTVAGGVEESIASRRQKIIAGGVAAAVLLLMISYLLGRRVGKAKSAVIEVRRY